MKSCTSTQFESYIFVPLRREDFVYKRILMYVCGPISLPIEFYSWKHQLAFNNEMER